MVVVESFEVPIWGFFCRASRPQPTASGVSLKTSDYTKQLIDQLNTTYGEVQQNPKGAQKQLKT